MRNRRWLANGLIGLGAILILVVIGYFGWSQVSAARLRAELRAAPIETLPAASAAASAPTETAAATATTPATSAPTATAAPTEPAVSPTAQAVAAAPVAPTATSTRAATRVPATVSPASTATATPPPAASATKQPTRKPAATTQVQPTSAASAATQVEPARLAIPDLKIDAKVVPMSWQVVNTAQGPRSEWVIPKDDAGHHINSAYLGEAGNLVISGHNNIYGRVFLNISQAWDDATRVKVDNFTDRSEILSGRRFTLSDAAGNTREYAITDFYRVRDTGVSLEQRIANGRFMLPTEAEQVTIITCWPPTNNTHRLVVIAKPAQ